MFPWALPRMDVPSRNFQCYDQIREILYLIINVINYRVAWFRKLNPASPGMRISHNQPIILSVSMSQNIAWDILILKKKNLVWNNLKFNFNWGPCILICYLWQPYQGGIGQLERKVLRSWEKGRVGTSKQKGMAAEDIPGRRNHRGKSL